MFKDLTNRKFNRLTVIKDTGIRNKKGIIIWKCLCDCGNYKDVRSDCLKNGNTKSCGCLVKEKNKETKTTHGKKNTITYKSWQAMKQRCLNSKNHAYEYYKNINICDGWLNSFEIFLEDMGERPSKEYTLDRIDNSKGYDKENCKWATRKEQTRNREETKLTNKKVREIRKILDSKKIKQYKIAEIFNITPQSVSDIKHFKIWSEDE